jgi:prolyl oligopeptidase
MTSRKLGGSCALAAVPLPCPREIFSIRLICFVALTAVLVAGASMTTRADSQAGDGKSLPGKCPPPTRKDDVVDTLHGVKIADPYRWLEDQNSPETRAWIEAQDACTRAVLDAVPGRAKITARLSQLMKVESVNPPIERNGVYVFGKRRPDQQLFVLYVRHGREGKDEVLVDPHPLSADHSTSVDSLDLSHDGSLAAYGVRTGGQDELEIHFIDTATRKELPDVLPRAMYESVAIEPSKRGVFYSRLKPAGGQLFHHVMGTASSADESIFGGNLGSDKEISASLSDDGHTLLLGLSYGSGSTRADLYVKDLRANGPVRPIVNDTEALFFGDISSGQLFVTTNWKAPHWHVYRVDLDHPQRDAWKEIVAESDAAIAGSGAFGGKFFIHYIRNAASELKYFDVDGKPAGIVPLPKLGSLDALSGDWGSNDVFFSFETFNLPPTVFRFDVKRGAADAWAKPAVPINSDEYTVEQVWFASKDQTRIPMFLFYKKGMVKDGARPTWLTAYGGFDVNETPDFAAAAVVWADSGGIFAMANLRGGGEFGEDWHRAGMREKKQTVFDDFFAAGEWLIANQYTRREKLAIYGGSNGGLLMGAAITQRPDLYGAVICTYPLLDMLRFQKFMDGPLWVAEYGSSDEETQFKYLLAYSPYQNVKDGKKYPSVLFITGDGDTRVAPLHARKMTARLQAANGSDRPILLLYDTQSGHSGGRPLNKEIEERTDILSFLYSQLGVNVQ